MGSACVPCTTSARARPCVISCSRVWKPSCGDHFAERALQGRLRARSVGAVGVEPGQCVFQVAKILHTTGQHGRAKEPWLWGRHQRLEEVHEGGLKDVEGHLLVRQAHHLESGQRQVAQQQRILMSTLLCTRRVLLIEELLESGDFRVPCVVPPALQVTTAHAHLHVQTCARAQNHGGSGRQACDEDAQHPPRPHELRYQTRLAQT